MDFRQLHNSLKNELSEHLNIYEWDTSAFTILPDEEKKGYLQLVELSPGTKFSTTWMVGIAVAEKDWEVLWDSIYNTLKRINTNLVHPPPCISPGGNLQIIPPVEVEVPSTYSQSTGISNTDGFKTAITFSLKLDGSR